MKNILDEEKLVGACEELSGRDVDLNFIFRTFGKPPLWARTPDFSTLVHIILEQQVSLASAKSAFDKLRKTLGEITPQGVLTLTDVEMKAAYFSRQKTVYVKELAKAILEKRLRLEEFEMMPDEKIKAELVKIKGVGNWTADIYLLMAMLRPDVMPKGDLALHVAWQRLKKSEKKPTVEEFLRIAEKWKPLRSVAARLLWHFYLNSRFQIPSSKSKISDSKF